MNTKKLYEFALFLKDSIIVVPDILEVHRLAKKEVSDRALPLEAVFASVSSLSYINGKIEEQTKRYGNYRKNTRSGLSKTIHGYMYHDDMELHFITETKELFRIPFNSLVVSRHKLGLMILSDGHQILVGKSAGLLDPKFSGAFRDAPYSAEVVWTKELERKGVVVRS